MRHSQVFMMASLLMGLALNLTVAQAPSAPVQGPEAPPSFEVDKAGKRLHIDFGLTPKPISDAELKFSHFANRKLLIFYFSAVCPHCQHAAPYVQKLADELTAKGFTAIAIAVRFNSEDDVRGFIRDYKIHMPVFQDVDKAFGDNYGTGSIPLLYVVNDKGEYIRYKTFNAEETPNLIKTEAAKLAVK
ncbi:MAG: thiol-disulfide oxidoreductase-like protein [Fibrobacteres bacterium]|nr:thiol-disulfide oxidoreductase-like protein [Fibrobacterota bacterium]